MNTIEAINDLQQQSMALGRELVSKAYAEKDVNALEKFCVFAEQVFQAAIDHVQKAEINYDDWYAGYLAASTSPEMEEIDKSGKWIEICKVYTQLDMREWYTKMVVPMFDAGTAPLITEFENTKEVMNDLIALVKKEKQEA